MAPYMPDEAGIKISLSAKVVFYWRMLWSIPKYLPNRPHLLATRTEAVRIVHSLYRPFSSDL